MSPESLRPTRLSSIPHFRRWSGPALRLCAKQAHLRSTHSAPSKKWLSWQFAEGQLQPSWLHVTACACTLWTASLCCTVAPGNELFDALCGIPTSTISCDITSAHRHTAATTLSHRLTSGRTDGRHVSGGNARRGTPHTRSNPALGCCPGPVMSANPQLRYTD